MRRLNAFKAFALAGSLLACGQVAAPDPANVSAKMSVLTLGAGHAMPGDPTFYVQATSHLFLMTQVEFSAPVASVDLQGVITTFGDDQGNDFSKDATLDIVRHMAQSDDRDVLSKDHRLLLMNVSAPKQLVSAARSVTLKGYLHVLPDVGTDTLTVENVPLQLGKQIKVGGVSLQISNVGISKTYTSVTFRSPATEAVKSVEFLDAAGKPIGLTYRVSRGLVYMADKTSQQTITYPIDRALSETVTLRITVYKDAKKIDVPFEVTTGIGF